MNSLWIDSCKEIRPKFPTLNENINVDVCVVGSGLTGITCAYLLSKAGLNVCVVEKDEIAHHASGNTTAKITSGHGLFYSYLINTFSEELAKAYLEANENAITNIKSIIDEENIECDFEWQDNYVFTNDENEISKIKDEIFVLNKLDYKAEFIEKIDYPINILAGVKYSNQAQFNPLKYVYALCKRIENNSGHIYENSKVIDIKQSGDFYNTFTNSNCITSKYVVLATGYPIINFNGFYFLKMYQEASYLIAVDTKCDLPTGMYINTKSPITSLRNAIYNGKKILLVGGSNFKVGDEYDFSNAYKNLENTAKSMYPNCEILFRWKTQDCISLDKIPYIGQYSLTSPNMYVATGFKKWGMTTSNVAANIITDKILGKENPYEFVFKSTRFHPIKNGTEFTNMLKQTVSSLVIDKFKIPNTTINDIQPESAMKVEINGTKLGIYKDNNGKLYVIKPICTHLGCELNWNNLDKSWDCPCHGSKFSYDGKSLYAPSIKDLDLIDIDID